VRGVLLPPCACSPVLGFLCMCTRGLDSCRVLYGKPGAGISRFKCTQRCLRTSKWEATRCCEAARTTLSLLIPMARFLWVGYIMWVICIEPGVSLTYIYMTVIRTRWVAATEHSAPMFHFETPQRGRRERYFHDPLGAPSVQLDGDNRCQRGQCARTDQDV
jgi:hypothetical protein